MNPCIKVASVSNSTQCSDLSPVRLSHPLRGRHLAYSLGCIYAEANIIHIHETVFSHGLQIALPGIILLWIF